MNIKKNDSGDVARYAPILSLLPDEPMDFFMIYGSSVRVRDKKSGYFRFVINSPDDIPALTKDIAGLRCRCIIVDADCESVWRDLFPCADFKRYKLLVITRDMIIPEDNPPEDVNIVPLDKSWDELVIRKFANEEFTDELLVRQLRETPGFGIIRKNKRVGFISTHLNKEIGPLWISSDCRGAGLGTFLLREYLYEYLKSHSVAFALVLPGNKAAVEVTAKIGFKVLDGDVLLGYLHE